MPLSDPQGVSNLNYEPVGWDLRISISSASDSYYWEKLKKSNLDLFKNQIETLLSSYGNHKL